MLTNEIFQSNNSLNQKTKMIEYKTRYYCETRGERRMKDKLSLANIIMNRTNMKGSQREQVIYMVKNDFKNLKNLSRNFSNEKIIAILCFYVIKSYNSSAQLNKYKIFKELKITESNCIHIFMKIAIFYREKSPLNLMEL